MVVVGTGDGTGGYDGPGGNATLPGVRGRRGRRGVGGVLLLHERMHSCHLELPGTKRLLQLCSQSRGNATLPGVDGWGVDMGGNARSPGVLGYDGGIDGVGNATLPGIVGCGTDSGGA